MTRRNAGQAILLLVVLAVAILSVVGIALKVSTDAERTAAGQEWAAGRAFHAADAGIDWAAAQMRAPAAFLSRPEFSDPPDPFGAVWLPLPGHRHGAAGPFTGDPDEDGIRVLVGAPSYIGRRPASGADGALFHYVFEVRTRAAENTTVPRYSRELVADLEVGPLPGDFAATPAAAAALGTGSGFVLALRRPAIPALPGDFWTRKPRSPRDILRKARSTEVMAAALEGGGFRAVISNWKEP